MCIHCSMPPVSVRGYCGLHERAKAGQLQHYDVPLDNEDAAIWAARGLHSRKVHETCNVCLQQSVNIYSKWNCMCTPSACADCVDKLYCCPICRTGRPFFPVRGELLLSVWDGCFSQASARNLALAYKQRYPQASSFALSDLVCTISEAQSAMFSLDLEETADGDADIDSYYRQIYSYAVDPWNAMDRWMDSPLVESELVDNYNWQLRTFKNIMHLRRVNNNGAHSLVVHVP